MNIQLARCSHTFDILFDTVDTVLKSITGNPGYKRPSCKHEEQNKHIVPNIVYMCHVDHHAVDD